MSDTYSADGQGSAGSTATPGVASGLFRSLQGLLATMVAMAHTRVELLSTELQEEVQRAAGLVTWTLIALLALMVALMMGGLTIVFVYWDTHRVLAALLVSGAFLALAIVAMLVLAVKLNARPPFLDATRAELAKDVQALRRQA